MSDPRAAEPERNQRKPHYSQPLNGYRGFCALLVFLFHIGSARVLDSASFGSALEFVWGALRLGVEMFFMISGYVILGSLLRHKSVGSFLRDRFIRIYCAWTPALIAVSITCALFHMKTFADVTPAQGVGLFVVNFFLLPPLFPWPMVHWGSWSLTFEWAFYLAASAAALLLRAPGGRSRWALGLWALATAAFVARYPRALFFLTGVLVFRHAAWFETHKRWWSWPVLSFLVFLSAWRLTGFDEGESSDSLQAWTRDGRWVYGLIAGLASLHMFASVVTSASRQTRFLESRALQFLGKISYSFYLWHALVMSFVKRPVLAWVVPRFGVGWGFALFCLLSSALSVVVAWASFSLFELRLARAAHNFWDARRRSSNAAVPAAHGGELQRS